MYKPGNLVDTINNQYSNDTQSIVADVLVDMVNGSTGIIDGAKKIGNRVIQKSIANNTGVKQQVQEITLDPIITQFKGTQCRTITFEWDLRPSNLAELKLCAEIVNRFKTYSLPSVSVSELEKDTGVGTTVLKTPHYFKINEVQIKKNTPKYYSMFSMAPCVITSVSVSASDEPMGASNTISGTGGDPVWNKLRVTFQELIPLTMEDQRLINERRNITTKGFPIPEPTGIESGNTSDDEKDKAYRDLIEDLRQKNKKSRELEHENTSTEINK